MTTATTTSTTTPEITTEGIEHIDFAATCHAYSKTRNETCGRPPVAFVEVHRVSDCKASECNSRGNMEGNVCEEHLDFFVQLAVDLIKEAPRTSPFFEYFGPRRLVCATCQLPLIKASDVLQKVIRF